MTEQAKLPTDRGLVWAYLLDRRGGAKRVGWEALETWKPEQGLIWAHFDISEPGPDCWLEERSGLEPPIADALLAEDTRPRSASSRNGLLVILRGVNVNPGAEADDMVSVRVWLERDRIITTRRRRLQANGAIRAIAGSRRGAGRAPGISSASWWNWWWIGSAAPWMNSIRTSTRWRKAPASATS